MEISLSAIDKSRFGVATAKSRIQRGDSVVELIAQARALQVELLIVRLPTIDIALAQELERFGAMLADTLIYYEKKQVEEYKVELPTGFRACLAGEGDAELVEQAAGNAFKDYFGHYHADPRLERHDCDAVYSSWARSSCVDQRVANAVVLVKSGVEVAAFATLKWLDEVRYEGVLFGVSPEYRNKGLHMGLMKLVQNWGVENHAPSFLTSTQINNAPVQKNWCRAGLEPLNSFYTFHIWLQN